MTLVKYKCPQCHRVVERDPALLKMNPVLKRCQDCGVPLKWHREEKKTPDSRRRSKDQERRAAKEFGAKQQPASGALPTRKSDIRKPGHLRGEMKETTADSYRLKLDDLLKLEREATNGEISLFVIEFQCVHPPKRYEILPAGTVASLIGKEGK